MEIKNKGIVLMALIAALFTFSACTTFSNHTESDEEILEKRVKQSMAARVNNQWGEVYDFFAPEYRKNVSKAEFAKTSRNIQIPSYHIESIEILPSGKEAVAKIKYSTIFRGVEFSDNLMSQKWIKKNGKWFLKMKPKDKEN